MTMRCPQSLRRCWLQLAVCQDKSRHSEQPRAWHEIVHDADPHRIGEERDTGSQPVIEAMPATNSRCGAGGCLEHLVDKDTLCYRLFERYAAIAVMQKRGLEAWLWLNSI